MLQPWRMHGTVQDYTGVYKVKEQLVYLDFATFTVGSDMV